MQFSNVCQQTGLNIYAHTCIIWFTLHVLQCVSVCGVLCVFACFRRKRQNVCTTLLCVCMCVGFLLLCIMTLLPKQYPKHNINTKEYIKGLHRFRQQQSRAEIDDVG